MTGVRTVALATRLDRIPWGPLVTIEADQSLWDAWQLLYVSGMRHLAVVDTEGRYLGVLADRSVLTDLPLTEEHLATRRVRDVMACPQAVSPEESPRCAARVMVDHAVEAAPLIDAQGRLVALVSATDLMRWLAGT